MIEIAGLFVLNINNELLIIHQTKKPMDEWTVPKGKTELGEPSLHAAIRETQEETNLDISKYSVIFNLEPIIYNNSEKIFKGFLFLERLNNIPLEEIIFNCEILSDITGQPEINFFKWETLDTARLVLSKTQNKCVDEIKDILGRLNKK